MEEKKDINKATEEDLKHISIEDETAKNILNYREDNEPIQDMNELKNIEGISESIIEDLKMNFYAGESTEEEEIVQEENEEDSEEDMEIDYEDEDDD